MGIQEEALISGLHARLASAAAKFDELNTHVDDPERHYEPIVIHTMLANQQALANLLVRKGVLGETEYTIEALTIDVQLVEAALLTAAEDLRQRTGVIVPLGMGVSRPQG